MGTIHVESGTKEEGILQLLSVSVISSHSCWDDSSLHIYSVKLMTKAKGLLQHACNIPDFMEM